MIDNFTRKNNYTVEDLVWIMQLLRSEGGCPWDREQDHHSIRGNLIEETYEAVEAIDREDSELLCEELGDVLLQVVLHSQMESEADRFDFNDVCDGICKKLIHRHPHVFGNVIAENSEEVLNNWDAIKKKEKKQETAASTLEAVSNALPSLIRAAKVQKRAAKSGYCYADVQGALADLKSELAELEQAIAAQDVDNTFEEIGDLLFSVVNVSRFLRVDPEEALYRSTDKFISRFAQAEALALSRSIMLERCTPQELDSLWREAKIKD